MTGSAERGVATKQFMVWFDRMIGSVVGCCTRDAANQSCRGFDHDDPVDRRRAREVMRADDGVVGAHTGTAVATDRDRGCDVTGVVAVEAVHDLAS